MDPTNSEPMAAVLIAVIIAGAAVTTNCVITKKRFGVVQLMSKRGYSRDFKPHGETGKRYLLDAIPAGLWESVRKKCRRNGVSVRAQILQLLKEWVGLDR